MLRHVISISGIFLFIACTTGCSRRKAAPADHLGDIRFDVSGKPEAQAAFKKGLLLLHSFEYVDAAEQFLNARTTDPGFVMAYWGEAMTKNHPLWQEQDYDKGNEILSKLAATAEDRVKKAKTELEKDFIGGVNILFGQGNKAERDSSYAVYMESLYKKYPGNDEVAAFYSLSLDGWGTTDTDKKILEKAAAVALEVLGRNPRHPGALHYLIHAYDDPAYAAKALQAADKYAQVAPDAGHALHMPTHTYLALGLWDKVISSNIVSWAAEKARKKRKNLDNDALGYHAYHWLLYGYLQENNFATARNMLDSMKTYCTELPSPKARSHMIFFKTTYIAETNDFSNEIMNMDVPVKDLNITVRARNAFINGMKAYRDKDAGALDNILLQMTAERLADESKASDKGLRVCGNINRSLASKTDLEAAEVMELELKAMRAWMNKDTAATDKLFKEATALQTICGYSYGPPDIVKPSYEMYGEWLLDINRPAEAVAEFDRALNMYPNRSLSVRGKATARQRSGNRGLASL